MVIASYDFSIYFVICCLLINILKKLFVVEFADLILAKKYKQI